MTRSARSKLIFDPEVEKTAKRNRKLAREKKLKSAAEPLFGQTGAIYEEESKSEPETISETKMANREEEDSNADNPYMRDLTGHSEEDLATPILLPENATQVEIKLALLNVLPKYYGKNNEDPYNFLNEFIKICKVQRRPAGVTEEQFKLVAFPFSMSGAANQWFSSLAPNSVTSWSALKKQFLDYFFPATKTEALRKEITSIKQEYDEPMSTFWLRFRRLVDSCPNHRYTEGQLLQIFYQGLTAANKDLMNTAANGGFSEIRVDEGKHESSISYILGDDNKEQWIVIGIVLNQFGAVWKLKEDVNTIEL